MLSQDRFSNFSCVIQTAKDSPHVFAFSFASRVRGLSRHSPPSFSARSWTYFFFWLVVDSFRSTSARRLWDRDQWRWREEKGHSVTIFLRASGLMRSSLLLRTSQIPSRLPLPLLTMFFSKPWLWTHAFKSSVQSSPLHLACTKAQLNCGLSRL